MRRPGDELPMSGRLVALDLGRTRVGVAVSDPLQVVATPADTVAVEDLDLGAAMDVEALAARLADVVDGHGAAGVVVGAPLDLDGREGEAAREARATADAVRALTGLAVRLVDERFTTSEAERVLLAADVSRAGRRKVVDRVAASVLLQGVLRQQELRRTQGAQPDHDVDDERTQDGGTA
jgi:putative holliday junction resolvase